MAAIPLRDQPHRVKKINSGLITSEMINPKWLTVRGHRVAAWINSFKREILTCYHPNKPEPGGSSKSMEYQIVCEDGSNPKYLFEKGILINAHGRIPLYRYLSRENSRPEYVFLLHGLGSYKESWLAPRTKFEEKSTQLKDDLLSRGYNLLIPDAPFHGERSYELDFLPAHLLPPEISQSTEAAEKMVELYQNSVQEIRLMVDLIQAQASGTPEQIHLVGYSLGGAVAILVNAVDDRLGSIAACVPPINRPISEVKSFNWPEGLVKKLAEVTPFSHAEQQKAPTAIFYGEEDIYYSQTEIQDFYLRAPVPEKLVKGYPTGHELPASYIQDVIEWIEQHSA